MSLDLLQIADRTARTNIGTVANETLDNYSTLLDDKLSYPLNVTISGTVITVSASTIQKLSSNGSDGTQNSYKWRIPPISSTDVTTSSSTIDLSSGSTTGSFKFASDPGTTVTANYYIQMGIEIRNDGYLYVVWGSQASSLGSTTIPSFTTSNAFPIVVIKLQKNGSTGTWNFLTPSTNSIEIIKGGSGAGGGSTASNTWDPGEIVDTLYQARVYDNLQTSPTTSGVTPININTGYTNATFNSSGPYFQLSYDASKSISCTGVTASASNTPTFTVIAGDVLIVNGYARKITTVSTQTSYTLESAFPTDPSGSACCISQCVYTYDLNNFTSNSTGLAVSSQLTGSISQVLVGYADASSGIIPNYSTTPGVAYTLSADGSSYTSTNVRPTTLASELYEVATPTSGTNFYIRFFSNASSGSGTVNLLSYKGLWQKQTAGAGAGTTQLVAFARPYAGIYVNCSYSVVAGKGRFTFTVPYGAGLTTTNPAGSALDVFGNGQKFPFYVSGVTDPGQAYFKEINSTVIELDQDYSLTAVEFLMKTPQTVIDSNTTNTSRIANLEGVAANTALSIVARPYISVPYTTIVGRATIPDLTQDLSIKGPVDRICIQEIYQILNESGSNGETIWGAKGDRDGLVRFISSNWYNAVTAYGSQPRDDSGTAILEITFYGTGLNILSGYHPGAAYATIDGGTEGSNFYPVNAYNVLGGRNYSANVIIPVVSGLTVGLHTVKIRNAYIPFMFEGYEVLNESTTEKCLPGTYYYKGSTYVNSIAITLPYIPAAYTSGGYTKGACVLNYVNSSGVEGQVFTPVPASPSYGSGASHTNEQMIRQYNFREFGAGRSDDFSLYSSASPANLAFALDDGTNALAGYQTAVYTVGTNTGLGLATSGYNTLTFVGTGLDLDLFDSNNGGNDSYTYQIDGGTATAWFNTAGSTTRRIQKICSGLPYGTHTFRVTLVSASLWCPCIVAFRVYAPAVPTLPANSAPLGQYYLMANYVANSTAGLLTIGQGLLRKQICQREAVYVGSGWGLINDPSAFIGGWFCQTNTSGTYVNYIFYGVGFEFRARANTSYSSNISVKLQSLSTGGSLVAATTSNFPTLVSTVCGGFSFSSGTLSQAVSNVDGSGLTISGLPLGLYLVQFLNNSSAYVPNEAFDIICPIHYPKIQTDGMKQNTLPVGSCSMGDLRTTWLQDTQRSKVRAVATGVYNGPTTSSTSFVPIPDMSLTVNSPNYPGGDFDISYYIGLGNSSSSYYCYTQIFVDSIAIGQNQQLGSTTAFTSMSDSITVYLSQGAHKIDVYWKANNASDTITGTNWSRTLKVIEL